MSVEIIIESHLQRSPLEVWKKISTLQGVNEELAPFVRMTASADQMKLPFTEAPIQQKLFTSVLLLFRVIPVDLHFLKLDDIWQYGFRENSSSLMHAYWQHERTITGEADNCVLKDHLKFKPRLPLIHLIMRPIVRFIFEHRHRQLQKWFNP